MASRKAWAARRAEAFEDVEVRAAHRAFPDAVSVRRPAGQDATGRFVPLVVGQDPEVGPVAAERIVVQPDRVSGIDASAVLTAVASERERMARQIESLERVVAAIVEGSELTSTDDEHDPEGATIAYERSQAMALLRQARSDLDALEVTSSTLKVGQRVLCAVCGGEIDLERLAALPTASRCIRCAR